MNLYANVHEERPPAPERPGARGLSNEGKARP